MVGLRRNRSGVRAALSRGQGGREQVHEGRGWTVHLHVRRWVHRVLLGAQGHQSSQHLRLAANHTHTNQPVSASRAKPAPYWTGFAISPYILFSLCSNDLCTLDMLLLRYYTELMKDKTASEQIDVIISSYEGWKGQLLIQLREAILQTDSTIFEEVKWKMKTRPNGLPVWSHDGIICFAEIWKDNIKLLFPKGAKLNDPSNQFNARLKSKVIRAIEFKEGTAVNNAALQELVYETIKINSSLA